MSEKDFVPYESTHRIRPLLFVTTVVNQGQGEAVAALCRENEAYFTIISYGKGTASRDFYSYSPSTVQRKEIVFSIMREDKWAVYKAQLKERFSISELARGIAYSVPLSAVAGVSIYKMLSNTRQFEKPHRKNKEAKS